MRCYWKLFKEDSSTGWERVLPGPVPKAKPVFLTLNSHFLPHHSSSIHLTNQTDSTKTESSKWFDYSEMGHHNGLLTKVQNGTLETRNLGYTMAP
jgi:hypothetical protein